MKKVCVYCGSSLGARKEYERDAVRLGLELVRQGLTLVYGGGNIGLMGKLADTVMDNGGKVIGVIPKNLFKRELAKKDVTELIVAEDMHERKHKMAELSDAFIALPGGIGTLEEFAEAVTWNQLRIHQKPCGFLNTGGYFDDLIRFLEHSVKEDFFKRSEKTGIAVEQDPCVLLAELERLSRKKSAKDLKEVLE